MYRFIAATLLIGCILSGCSQYRAENSVAQNPTVGETSTSLSDSTSAEKSSDPDALSETEIAQLFCDAMTEINHLATEDPSDNLKHIFDDVEILDGVATVNQIPYIETSLPYDGLVDYYGSIFTGDALDWVLSTIYTNINGMVYCSSVGGMSGIGFTFVSIENLQENTYQGTYLTGSSEEEQHTTFSIRETDAGYRISSIDYHPDILD